MQSAAKADKRFSPFGFQAGTAPFSGHVYKYGGVASSLSQDEAPQTGDRRRSTPKRIYFEVCTYIYMYDPKVYIDYRQGILLVDPLLVYDKVF